MEEKNRHIRDSRYGWIEFSVILIVYNLEHYLRKTVQSVLDQEFKNFELIIVDDGSTDGWQGGLRRPLARLSLLFSGFAVCNL